MYKCKIIGDSINPQNDRLTTFVLTYPRIVHSEMMTHRMFSRNSASSRAIPFKKMVKMVEENPFIPIAWQKDHKGMQGTEYFSDELSIEFARSNWLTARDNAVKGAMSLHSTDNGYDSVTKQLCNRLLEPFMWHTVIVTSGKEGLNNFFELRCPKYDVNGNLFNSRKDALEYAATIFPKERQNLLRYNNLGWLSINKSQADIHIQAIAELMFDAYNESTPKELQPGEWHIPNFGHEWDNIKVYELSSYKMGDDTLVIDKAIEKTKVKISVAHCARISYQTLGDNPKIDYKADIKLHDMLAESGHWSPFEHVARAMTDDEYYNYSIGQDGQASHQHGWCRNFRGFVQYRALVD